MNIFIVVITLLATVITSWGWENNLTHPRITKFAAEKYFNPIDPAFLNKSLMLDGKNLRAIEWIRRGSILEDSTTPPTQYISGYSNGTARSFNHFHDPTVTNPTKTTLETAGLSDRFTGMSAISWAQNGLYQMELGWTDWSWNAVRTYQYNYLTSLRKIDVEANLARMLMGLGYQMHLLQDMGQPSHVRNNTHILDGAGWSGFETWAMNNDVKVISAQILDKKDDFGNYVFPIPDVAVDLTAKFDLTHNLTPVARLFDTRGYLGLNVPTTALNQGLSEYTNGNYFSQNTIFAAERFSENTSHKFYFPYPRKGGTDLQQFIDNNKVLYISKTGEGERFAHLAMAGASTRFLLNTLGAGKSFFDSFKLDEACYLDYAQKLIPRAVGYSKAMLDYFYRGKIEVKPVSTGSSTITVSAKNTTTNSDAMTGGTLDLVLRYRSAGDPDQLFKIIPLTDYQYLDIKLTGNNQTIDTTAKEFTFDLSATPLPDWANEVTASLVYRGKLGNEADAVAVGNTVLKTTPRKMTLSLPADGVYGETDGSEGFTQITVSATANIPGLDLADGLIELVLTHRTSDSDPFQGAPVTTSPAAPLKYHYIRASEETGKTALVQGQKTELTFDISENPLPIWASDVYMYISYKKAGDPDSMARAVGYLDISEPTPVDVFNNADKICMYSQWYNAGSAAAIALVDTNHNGVVEEVDVYANNITNIYYRSSPSGVAIPASATDYSISAPAKILWGSSKRLGYILTDYSFNSSFTQDWVDGPNFWGDQTTTETNPATAVKHQTDPDGKYTYPSMQTIRGQKIWWGAGIIYDNYEYPSDGSSKCSWDAL